jgi:hypothetical protein
MGDRAIDARRHIYALGAVTVSRYSTTTLIRLIRRDSLPPLG